MNLLLPRSELTTETPDTLILGVWIADEVGAVTAVLRTQHGQLRPDLFTAAGEPYVTLAGALEELRTVNARHLLLLSNDDDLLRRLRRPHQWAFVHPNLWPPEYWDILRECAQYHTWRASRVDNLPKARELWLSHQLPQSTTV